MITDVIKTVYLFIYKFFFSIFKVLPIKRKVVMYVTFRQNAYYIIRELLSREIELPIVLICNKASYRRLKKFENNNVKLILNDNKLLFFKKIFHLSTAKIIIVDNYFPFLAATNFKKEVECIQIWHAAGAIKSFGLPANNTHTRTKISIKRFHSVYNRFDKIVIGSDEMGTIFKKAFGLKKDIFLKTGIPRTDLFYLDEKKEQLKSAFLKKYPMAAKKKIILYAPTFRDTESYDYKLDIPYLKKKLGDQYYLIAKLHPVTKQTIIAPDEVSDFFKLIDSPYDVNELLQVTDILITDYSSIPFEFCILEKPMVFFPYDLVEYSAERGLWMDYESFVPGPVAKDTESLVDRIQNIDKLFDRQAVKEFNEIWNKYSKGQSSKDFVDYIMKRLDENQVIKHER
ncbi:CDP-glycerol glycerophosphotransferase family protein [Jeotgalibacillus proteolyticus]|uniref:CDP-glycerol--glycerophosphate glycerophosphotransferase n=1 Tax=Jeotgalibacillus proteolyticus TaxID=2082395 RepID=A0A2S5GBJ4_9BACL|nr:CDP-glycerol glycerophosphotransferase family protein [Jeotgalibacillus proteolyticus]PPA70291.1 CDP-glycerol--glycerophosphate glycerophosphotransferase [Jeotgalibacillus proteolyticus]